MNRINKAGMALLLTFTMLLACLTGCTANKSSNQEATKAEPFDGSNYLEISTITASGENLKEAAENYQPSLNYDTALSVPTYVTCVDDVWFIVDCYHNRVIYSEDLGAPLNQWYIMSSDVTQPHTIASDGKVYIIDDTENNRILVYEKEDGKFINTQALYNVGSRPHYTVYDEVTDTFYVWSSITGELYCFRHTADSTRIYLTEIKKIPELDGIYVRSFSIIDGDIYFVSGVSDDSSSGYTSQVLCCSLSDLSVKRAYDVPDELAGMVQIMPIGDYYYISSSTDKYGSQDYATLVRTKSFEDLAKGNYEDVYSQYFIGGGTPYYMSQVGDTYFLTEHRLQGHSIWSFKVDKPGNITEVTALY
ncbi:hypothetical protein [Butyrivibrio proteoclasticus]|uniref:hypothetical protein n=1 Tax=Butyrivibrio proteoclasticus TaxID=43305 RepID=UPI0006847A49|nr:hypothetical protein [Butyrivibrio proteoclasticus]